MTGLFRPFKRRAGVLVVGIAAVGGIGVLVSRFAGGPFLAGGAGLIAVGYVVAVLVGLFTAREPRSVAYLAVAAGGVLLALSALVSARVTFVVAALLLAAGGGLLYRAGQPPPDDSPGGSDRPTENGPTG